MTVEAPPDILDPYLDMVMTCPVEAGQAEAPQPLRVVLASDTGPKIQARVIDNVKNAQELVAAGIAPERAAIIAFGGALVLDEAGEILREPEPEPAPAADHPQLQLQGVEKK
ncbi:MAG TPA: hypothetical protein VIJ68_04200 [Candidatus Saccharimonadales bacterium]